MADKLSPQQKDWFELALDIGLVLVAGDIAWTMIFGQPPLWKEFHAMIGLLGTVAAMVLVWKMARKNKALS